MANPSKFASVNLNKSYGKPSSSSSSAFLSPSSSSGSGHGSRARSSLGGGGTVVLSRHRSSVSTSQKTGPRLAVPPPLNLPSLRKEHERFDPSSTGSNTGAGSSSLGSVNGPSTMGWTKPGLPLPVQDKDAAGDQRVSSPVAPVYRPPGTISAAQPFSTAALGRSVPVAEKVVVFRGEDFPSLLATCTSSQKQKDTLNQKQKQVGEVLSDVQAERPSLESPFGMRPHFRSSHLVGSKGLDGNGGLSFEQQQKQDGVLPSLLPLVQLVHASDWDDDERDIGHGIPDRNRDRGISTMESIGVYDLPSGQRQHDSRSGSVASREIDKGNSFGRDLFIRNSEGQNFSSWRVHPHGRDGFGAREVGVDRDGLSREMGKASNNYNQSLHVDSVQNGTNGVQDSRHTRRDFVYVKNIQIGRDGADTSNGRNTEQRINGRYGDLSDNGYEGDGLKNSSAPKEPFSSGSKGFSLNNPMLNFGREKRDFSISGKSYQEATGFDSSDPFSGGLIGDVNTKVIKRKKDLQKQIDFHDPVRESFEAELKRVQRMQEQERQRMVEKQAKALELALKEEEERETLGREEEERKRKLEEEAMVATWRAEQEKSEALKRAEEQKLAREEEKRRIAVEEERRKEAARQKLLELEERIAIRQAKAATKDARFLSCPGDEQVTGEAQEPDAPRVEDIGDWEDGERMVEHITGSESSDSYSMNRFFEIGSRSHSSRYGNTSSMERERHTNSCKRDAFDIRNNLAVLSRENGYHSPRRDVFCSGRECSRKEFYGGPVSSVSPSLKGGMPDPPQLLDVFSNPRGSQWNIGGHNDRCYGSSDIDAGFIEIDKFGDGVWGQSRSHGSPHALYGDGFLQNSEVDGFSTFGSARRSLRQPRVLPPPSVSSLHKMTLRAASETPISSVEKSRYQTAGENDEEITQVEYESRYQERLKPAVTSTSLEITIPTEQRDENNTPSCDSQSSHSVSSPPSSPTHLSHDDLDEYGNFPTLTFYADGKQLALSDNEHVVSASEVGKTKIATASGSVSPGEDDEWVIEKNNQEMQGQEIYDEENSCHKEDGVHGGNNVNDLSQIFEDLHPDVANVTCELDQLVLGFDNGVEVRVPHTDEFGRTFETSENETQIAKVGSESGPLVALVSNGECGHHSENTSSHGMEECSSNIDTETEKAPEDLTLHHMASSSYFLDSLETFGGSGMPAHEPVTSAFDLLQPATSAQSILPSNSDVPNQAEVPLKLQFGLFSGPSLIPSPVPPIQIGSIQLPLHLHTPVLPSLTQLHSSQPPYFQFGQMKSTSPISQGILPLAPQSISFVQSDAPTQYSLSQQLGSSLHSHMNHNNPSYSNSSNDKMPSVPSNKHVGLLGKSLDLSQEKSDPKEPKAFLDYSKGGVLSSQSQALSSQSQAESSMSGENKNSCESVSQLEHQWAFDVPKMNNPSTSNREPHGLLAKPVSSPYLSVGKAGSGLSPGSLFGSRGKRYFYTVRSATSRSFPRIEASHTNSGGFQRRPHRNNRRTKFSLRENDRRTEGMDLSIYAEEDEKPNFKDRVSSMSVRNGAKRNHLNNSTRLVIDSHSETSGASQAVHSEGELGKISGNKAASKKLISSVDNLHPGEGNLKRNSSAEEDVDAPLQTGVVRIFNQPGIEAPSDDDDFIEVRSKRQMLNDRREQREKEIKAKKGPWKSHYISQRNGVASISDRVVGPQVKVASISILSDPVISDGTGFANGEQSIVFTTNIATQSLHPIGTPAVNAKANKRSHTKSVQTSSVSVISACATELVPGSFENRNVVVSGVPTALGSWEHAHMNQKVMNLTQTQLDEAMKPVQFDTHVTSIVDHTGIVLETAKQTASVMIQDKSFPSSARSLNSMLAGEKIQFGAVTSPVILPAFSRVVTNGIGPQGSWSCQPDVSIDRNLPATVNNCTMLFEKEKHTDEFVVHLEDPEAETEAEAAASAVAVAAISSDEVVGLGTCSVSADTKSFQGAGVSVVTSRGSQEVTSQTSGEESLSVALPVDLSVETPMLSLWPHLPSPQSSSTPLLSHIPGPPPSHFPFFEVNPMSGGPIFAFGPHDESVGTQSQPQRSTTLGSNPLAAWPQCHSGVDSFYGPPAGFTGPFISPGGPGVQGPPPHMFFYNHFTPIGQFGQQVLSFMGTTYIPSVKQPDWKHDPVSTAVAVSNEIDIKNLNVVPGQRNPSNIPAPIQHLAPGSPLMPMASPLAMFDMSPFESSADLPLQARWPRVPVPTVHSVPLSLPLQPHQVDGGISPAFSHSLPVESCNRHTRFHEPCSSPPSDGSLRFTLPADYPAQFADGLGLVGTLSDSSLCVQTSKPSSYSGNNSRGHGGKNSSRGTVSSSSNNHDQSMYPAFKLQPSQPSTSSAHHSLPPVKNANQRGGGVSSQKLSSGGEWHRNKGFQRRNQMWGAEKNFTSTSTSKIKQIYMAKPPATIETATLG